MITYTLKELDVFNFRQYKIPPLPKYQTLTKFINKMNQMSDSQMNRQNFGEQAPKVYFKPAKSTDDVVKGKINELMSKITENNQDELLEQFRQLPFDQIENCVPIANTMHNAIINCYKYHKQYLDLISFLATDHPRFNSSLRRSFLDYDNHHLSSLEQLDTEEKFIAKGKITTNYEMLVLLYKNGVLFQLDDINGIITKLGKLSDISSIEVFIRFLKILKDHHINVEGEIIDKLGQKISEGDYPKRIAFLVMDLA